MRSVRFPSRGVLVARAWQALCRGPFFIAGWFFLVPAVCDRLKWPRCDGLMWPRLRLAGVVVTV